MRIVSSIMMLGCLLLAGCGTFAKQSGKTPPAASTSDPRLPWPPANNGSPFKDPGAAPAPAAPNWPAATPASASGILAGQILDGFNRPPPAIAYIQVAMTQDGGQGAPIEVAADDHGYFTIQGVTPGKHYRLIARCQYGDKLLAGTTFATPPNPRVIIRIGEDNASDRTPPPPPPPTMPKGKAKAAADASPAWSPLGPRPAGLGTPVVDDPPVTTLQAPVPPPPPALRPEDIARGLARNDPPVASIPGPGRWQPADAAPITVSPPPAGPAPVPSCVLVGRQLHNFALYDLNGQPWEFRDHRAKLTLVDFWGSWCTPCLHAIPHLRILQERYGPYGLQVVGIAYEDGSPQVQAGKVRRVADRLQINYQLLLGGERMTCPVRSQFRVASWPTLVLLDEQGRILWQSVGLQPQSLTELDAIVRQQLGIR